MVTHVRPLLNGAMIVRREDFRRPLRAWFARLWGAVLRVPLLGKLLGANLLLVLAAVGGHFAFPSASTSIQLGITLSLSFVVTAMLVGLALRPIVQLEATAERVSDGDFEARVPESRLADRQTIQLATTMNRLLDRVSADRARIQYLAGRSVRARDVERESVARELRESFAQSLSAISLQVAATRETSTDPSVAEQLDQIRDTIRAVTDDMRSVAESLYPGTLEEFGLANAIEALTRRLARRSSLQAEVVAEPLAGRLSPGAASALYRVADEALRNVEQHAGARQVRVVLRNGGDDVSLEVEDDGRGIEMRRSDPLQAGLGLFSAKTLLALAGGELQISSAPDRGTRVVARVPARGVDT
ncbi:MAG TPA: ATP-binding protein [Gemmatimonadaceae bacterium]|nr:ATP-binding protein [Gemmatimonadaceae bacterium]